MQGPKEMKGELKPFDWPQYASLDPIVVKTTVRCRMYKIWFAGNGYMRMQCKVRGKGEGAQEEAEMITWSCIQVIRERKDEEHRLWLIEGEKIERAEAEHRLREERERIEEATFRAELRELEGPGSDESESDETGSDEVDVEVDEEDEYDISEYLEDEYDSVNEYSKRQELTASPEPAGSSTGEEWWTSSEEERSSGEEEDGASRID